MNFVDHVKSLEPGPVNLDGMDKSDLHHFIAATRGMNKTRAAGRMFKGLPRASKVVHDLNNYAWTKLIAMNCREIGKIDKALSYEGICERIYNDLPEYARW